MHLQYLAAAQEPLAAFRLFETGDLDDAREFVGRTFCPHRLDLSAPGQRLNTAHNHVRGRSLSLNFLRYGAEVNIEPGELTHFYLIQIPLQGAAAIRHGGRDIIAGPGIGSVLNPTLHTRMTWSGDCEKLLVQIDRRALQAFADMLTAQALPSPVVFRADVPMATEGMRHWLRILLSCCRAAESSAALQPTVAPTQVLREESLVLAFLATQESNLSPLLNTARPSGACPRQVKRARDYMHANLGMPISMSDVAAAAGCTLRTLQISFRKTYGRPPLHYLIGVRVALAHYLLQSSGPEATVAEIAERTGFDHLGRFAATYRERFGRNPGATLMANGMR